jgi:hypothetical protein
MLASPLSVAIGGRFRPHSKVILPTVRSAISGRAKAIRLTGAVLLAPSFSELGAPQAELQSRSQRTGLRI